MDITEQVCSPDRARALKERGVAQDSFFCWYPVPDGGAGELHYHPGLRHELEEQKDIRMRDTLAAFTVAELGCMLPDGAISYRIANGEYRCTIRGADVATGGETEADARADMLLLILSVQHPTDPKPFVIE